MCFLFPADICMSWRTSNKLTVCQGCFLSHGLRSETILTFSFTPPPLPVVHSSPFPPWFLSFPLSPQLTDSLCFHCLSRWLKSHWGADADKQLRCGWAVTELPLRWGEKVENKCVLFHSGKYTNKTGDTCVFNGFCWESCITLQQPKNFVKQIRPAEQFNYSAWL